MFPSVVYRTERISRFAYKSVHMKSNHGFQLEPFWTGGVGAREETLFVFACRYCQMSPHFNGNKE
jgi:hypothetical protein